MHLGTSTRKSKNGIVYKYYSIVESFRNEEGKSRKRAIKPLGKLSENEVADWKFRLSILNGNIKQFDLMQIDKMEYIEAKRYLDVALISNIYDQLEIGKAFEIIESDSKKIGCAEVAKILIISRCLDPVAKYKTVDWFQNSYLPELMDVDKRDYNRSKIFRELPNIHFRKKYLQKHFKNILDKISPDNNELFFFDGTTSFFEGDSTELGKGCKDKTHGYQDKVILICLLTNRSGYPVAWDVFAGNKKDVSEFKKIATQLQEMANIKDITFCFDRGVASASNFKMIEDQLKSKFITGLSSNQISPIFNIQNFVENTRSHLLKAFETKETIEVEPNKTGLTNGFYRLGKDKFFRDLGVVNNKRYVVSFNCNIYIKEKKIRADQIENAKKELDHLNNGLWAAKADRDDAVVEKNIDVILSKNKLKGVVNYQIIPIIKNLKTTIQTYKVTFEIDTEKLEKASLYDGVLVYITNHIEADSDNKGQFKVTAYQIVKHYKDKHVIENCFRHLKSFLDLRPIFVRLDDHVKAHVDICMCSYFIDHFINKRLQDLGISLSNFYSIIEENSKVSKIKDETKEIVLLRKMPSKIKNILKALNAKSIINKGALAEIGIKNNLN